MKINDEFKWGDRVYPVEHEDCDDFRLLPRDKITQARAICFRDGKLLLGFGGSQKEWSFIGGTIEKGESIPETLAREVKEESNHEVVEWKPISYQKSVDANGNEIYQVRVWCRVKPIGKFAGDPDKAIEKIELVEPADYKKYVNWGRVGDRLMERAVEIEKVRQLLRR